MQEMAKIHQKPEYIFDSATKKTIDPCPYTVAHALNALRIAVHPLGKL
jgi:hypothetical protein